MNDERNKRTKRKKRWVDVVPQNRQARYLKGGPHRVQAQALRILDLHYPHHHYYYSYYARNSNKHYYPDSACALCWPNGYRPRRTGPPGETGASRGQ
jgi:hypothetical protein